jgi:ferrochelatase
MKKVGVLVMAHGTPETQEEILPFYTRIRRGRPPTEELLTELTDRYQAIGGTSPLAQRTKAQVEGIKKALDPERFIVSFGAKHTDPSIEDAVNSLVAAGVDRVVGLVLAPHRASMGSAEYFTRARAAIDAHPDAPPFVVIEQWWDAPSFATLLAPRVLEALGEVDALSHPDESLALFTAHSLPARVVENGDDYPLTVPASAKLVAEAAHLAEHNIAFECGWQSAGRTADPWIGPDVLDVIRSLPDRGIRRVVVCPIGFVSDHLEVLYDLDFEAKVEADKAGVRFARTRSLNADDAFCRFLAGVIEAHCSSDS